MKLSTRLKKYVAPNLLFGEHEYNWNGDCTMRQIVLMVDGDPHRTYKTHSLNMADEYNRYLTKDEHCTLLPLNECPVVNPTQIVMHYTSTTYGDWCNLCGSKYYNAFVSSESSGYNEWDCVVEILANDKQHAMERLAKQLELKYKKCGVRIERSEHDVTMYFQNGRYNNYYGFVEE